MSEQCDVGVMKCNRCTCVRAQSILSATWVVQRPFLYLEGCASSVYWPSLPTCSKRKVIPYNQVDSRYVQRHLPLFFDAGLVIVITGPVKVEILEEVTVGSGIFAEPSTTCC